MTANRAWRTTKPSVKKNLLRIVLILLKCWLSVLMGNYHLRLRLYKKKTQTTKKNKIQKREQEITLKKRYRKKNWLVLGSN
jgi:hypothetical protein